MAQAPMFVGAAGVSISPFAGVELAGWGYYLERTWIDVADDLRASAIVVERGGHCLAIVALDLMVVGARLTSEVRSLVTRETGIPWHGTLVACTHSHNAPAAEGLLGVGGVDPLYERWAAHQAATAIIQAWRGRRPARLFADSVELDGLTFNRTRPNGPVDRCLSSLRFEDVSGEPIALVVNFQAHPTVTTVIRPNSVSRDIPGMVCDELAREFAPAVVLYLQGACGDVNFEPAFSTLRRMHEPARRIAAAVTERQAGATPIDPLSIRSVSRIIRLPTRAWSRHEVEPLRNEAQRRLRTRDVGGWRESLGRAMTNRPDEMIARHGGDEWKAVAAMCRFHLEWTRHMLTRLERAPDWLETEIQVLTLGSVVIAANSAELFSAFALKLRSRLNSPYPMIVSYANGRIGYLPDAHDIRGRSYAAIQSPRYCLQFPFVESSGEVLVAASATAAEQSGAV